MQSVAAMKSSEQTPSKLRSKIVRSPMIEPVILPPSLVVLIVTEP